MTKEDKMLLINSAAELYELGLEVESARESLKKLVERGLTYDGPEMIQAFERFTEAESRWKQLELEHLRLRENLGLPRIS